MEFRCFLFTELIFLAFFMHPTTSSSSSLILPLKAQQISPPQIIPKPPNKLSFRHNVSLTVSLSVGSPPQQVTMVLDTGSELSWLHCNKTPSSSFSPQISTSYRPIPCSSPTCTAKTRDFTIPVSCDANKLCHVILSYADMSSVEGNLASETFRIDGSNSNSLQQNMVFGCMDSSSTTTPDEDSKNTGLIGLNRGALSFVSQMGYPQFSYCISATGSSGVLLFGAANFPWLRPLNYTPMVQMSIPLPYFDRVAYTVQLEGIRVSNTILPLPKSVYEPDHTGAGQTMVDSGTQFTFLLGSAYTALRSEFLRQTRGVLRPYEDPNFVFQGAMDLCYRVELNRAGLPPLPSVNLMFRGVEMSVSGEKLLYRVPGMSRGSDGIFCFTFGNSDLLGVEAYVIGHHHQQDMWMEFDLANSRVGWADFRCDLASQRLGLPQ
ncbi:aspartic proteinase PCS1-like [Henckelia pumila]|uniref:aspartic proteinase PCS1-like n=1 Tax=Henckelia pumila TaxID=405737 RepID=UPI003C6E894B